MNKSRHESDRRVRRRRFEQAVPHSSEDPPPPGNLHVDPPQSFDRVTTAMLMADINSGGTGHEFAASDSGLLQLGTDDEAADTTPSQGRIATACAAEAARAV